MAPQLLKREAGEIAYDDTGGDGPIVVCVPGAGELRSSYRFLTPLLKAAGYRVVAADLRGQGESSPRWPEYTLEAVAGDLAALIEYVGAPAFCVGASLGGSAALWLASESPSKLAGLVLISPLVREESFDRKTKSRRFGGLRVSSWIAHCRKLYSTALPDDLDDHLAQLQANLKEKGRTAALKALLQTSKYLGDPRLTQVEAPTLVIVGSADPTFSDSTREGELVAHQLGGLADTLSVSGAGHYPHVEMPEKVASRLVEFLNRACRGEAEVEVT